MHDILHRDLCVFLVGSCNTVLEAGFPDGLPEVAVAYILRDVLRALENIHRMGYIHR